MRSGGMFGTGLAAGAILAWSAAMAADPPRRPPATGHGHATPPAPAVQGPEIVFQGCAYFDETGFAGRRVDVRGDASVEWLGREWNDRISSVACHAGCRLLGYEHINYGGARRSFSGAVPDAGSMNDRISALRVVCTAAPAGAPGHSSEHDGH